MNGYYGPTGFAGVPWASNAGALPADYLNSGYYLAGAGEDGAAGRGGAGLEGGRLALDRRLEG